MSALSGLGRLSGSSQVESNQVDPKSNLRRRVYAELAEIQRELQLYAPNDPVANTLKVWVNQFRLVLNQDDVEHVISEYVKLLEEIFTDPLNPQRPFHSELFRLTAPSLTRLMIGRMRDRASLFFSQRLADAAPEDAMPLRLYRLSDRLTAGMLRIQAMQAARQADEGRQMAELRALRERIDRVEAEQDARLEAVAQGARARFQAIGEDIGALQADIHDDRERLLAAAARLDQEAEQLRAEIVVLNQQIENVREGAAQVERASAQLQVSINQVREELKKRQSGWMGQLAVVVGIAVGAVCIQWALTAAVPGATFSASTSGAQIGMKFIF